MTTRWALSDSNQGVAHLSVKVCVSGITMMSASLYHHSYGSEDTFDLDMADL